MESAFLSSREVVSKPTKLAVLLSANLQRTELKKRALSTFISLSMSKGQGLR
jgi:hypothetical protein